MRCENDGSSEFLHRIQAVQVKDETEQFRNLLLRNK